MRITLNLATHPYVELRPLYQRLRVVALLLLVTGAFLWWVLRTQKQKATAAHARATTIETAITQTRSEREQAEASMRQPQNAAVLAQAQFLNNLFLHKSFSWTAVMMDLEQVLPAGVQVLNIDPVPAKDGSVTIHMRVAGPRDKAVSLVRNLEHSRRFRTPRIVGETSQAQNQNGRPVANFEPAAINNGVNFDVLAEYNPLEPRETKQTTKTGATKPLPHDQSRRDARWRARTSRRRGGVRHETDTLRHLQSAQSAHCRSGGAGCCQPGAGGAVAAGLAHAAHGSPGRAGAEADGVADGATAGAAAAQSSAARCRLHQGRGHFYDARVPGADSAILAELGALAQKANVRLSRVQTAFAPALHDVTEVRMDASVSGDYTR